MKLSNRQRKWLIWSTVSLTTMALLVGMAFYRPFQSKAGSALFENDGYTGPPPTELPGDRQTFLVLGVDKRPDDPGRSDTMMLVSWDPAKEELAAVSLQRDTWAQIPGHGYDKVNHSYAFGQEALSKVTVERLLGIHIDHYVTISFQGFQEIINKLDGIDITADKRLYYRDPTDYGMGPNGLTIDIQAGFQHMDGVTALGYARFRHDNEGDYGRMRRQQQVMKAVMEKGKDVSLTQIPGLISATFKTIGTDLTVSQIVKLATTARGALSKPLKTMTLAGDGELINGIYYAIPDLVAERTAIYKLFVGEDPPADFIAKANADQQTYQKALADATGRSKPPSADNGGSKPPSTGNNGGQTPPVQPGQGDGQKPPTEQPGDGQKPPTEQPGDGQKPPDGGTTPPPIQPPPTEPPPIEPPPIQPPPIQPPPTTDPKPQPITIAIIDASGRDLAARYVQKFKDAGFRVARVQKAPNPIGQTVAIDYAGQPGTAQRVKAVIPKAMIITQKDPNAQEAVEVYLGSDLTS